jgi:hypothetical protein
MVNSCAPLPLSLLSFLFSCLFHSNEIVDVGMLEEVRTPFRAKKVFNSAIVMSVQNSRLISPRTISIEAIRQGQRSA